MSLKAWEVDLITSQADESTCQSSSDVNLDYYHARIIGMVGKGKAITVSYEDLKTVYWVHLINDYTAEFHVFSSGGVHGLIRSFRRFQVDIWQQCKQLRVETRVRKPALHAILKRCGVPVEGIRRAAWFDKATCQLIDERVYALHRQSTALAPPSKEMAASFENQVAALAVGMVEHLDILTLPVRHFFPPGQYIRELTIPKGTCVIGYRQNHDHCVIISGDLVVKDAAGVRRFTGPHNTFISKAGVQRIAYAFEDTVFTTSHILKDPDERDIKKIEAELFSGSFSEFKTLYLTNQEQRLLECQVH